MSRSAKLALVLGGLLATPLPAAAQAIGPGFELERSGRYAEAASMYMTTIRSDPVNVPALLGLERTLFVLNRMPELLPLVQRARERSPENAALRSLEVRVYAALNEPDSLDAVVARWAATMPHSDVPYREWGLALADHRRWDEARRAYLTGRKALGGDGTLAIEMAELEQRANNWEAAAAEWSRAVVKSADVAPNAASQLADAPPPTRERVARVLSAADAPLRTKRVGAEVLLSWGRANEAWALLEPTLGDSESQAALRRFADLAGSISTPEGHRVRGLALNRWADLVPSPLSERARAEAVRELLDGGDRAAARKVLEGLATDHNVPGEANAMAQAALLQVLIADGQLDVVEQRLAAASGGGLNADDREALRLDLAKARIARGELDRADAALGTDSSVAAIAQRGWIDLYRGDLKGAMEAFRMAGPYATDRAAATERTAMMAVLQRIQVESSPELGAALLTLARGDTSAAVGALRRAAYKLPLEGGRLEVLLLGGQAAARSNGEEQNVAIALFDEIVRGGKGGGSESAAMPAAELEWSRLLIRNGRASEAIPHLENLILTYPNSAFVPEARRVLERARGAIPKS